MTDTKLIEATERLIEYLLEAHKNELDRNHYGDTTVPETCSYCLAIDEARQAVAMARLPKPAKVAKLTAADKKLAQDIERAEKAIVSLERVLANPASIEVHLRGYDFYLHTDASWKSESWDKALQDEAERLRRAIVTPGLLWSIYRRKDSGPSYVSSYDSMDTVRE